MLNGPQPEFGKRTQPNEISAAAAHAYEILKKAVQNTNFALLTNFKEEFKEFNPSTTFNKPVNPVRYVDVEPYAEPTNIADYRKPQADNTGKEQAVAPTVVTAEQPVDNLSAIRQNVEKIYEDHDAA